MKNNPSKVQTISRLRPLLAGLLMIAFLSSFFGYSMSEKRKMAFKITDQLSQHFKKKYGLKCVGVSEAAPEGKYQNLGLELNCYRILSKDQGRILLLNCVKDALAAFNANPQFLHHMEEGSFTEKNLTITIHIKPPNNPKAYYPNICVFTYFSDKVRFYTDTPESEKRFQYFSIEKEPLEEAMKIVEAQKGKP